MKSKHCRQNHLALNHSNMHVHVHVQSRTPDSLCRENWHMMYMYTYRYIDAPCSPKCANTFDSEWHLPYEGYFVVVLED